MPNDLSIDLCEHAFVLLPSEASAVGTTTAELAAELVKKPIRKTPPPA